MRVVRIYNVEELGGLIRDRRRRLGWSQETLALKVGAQRLWVSQVESGKDTAQVGLVLRALQALGCALDIASPDARSSAPSTSESAGEIDLDQVLGDLRKENNG